MRLLDCAGLGARATVQERAQVLGTPSKGGDPNADLPWGIMAYVLGVPALQVCHPVLFVVSVKPDNTAFHGHPARVRLTGS